MQQDWRSAALEQGLTTAEGLDLGVGAPSARPDEAPGEVGAASREGEGDDTPRRSVRDLTPQELGARGELMAARYLEGKDWEILERNWRCPFGEVDIIARQECDAKTAVLVEVKTRLCLGRREDVVPELAVDEEKQERYRRCALRYFGDHPEFKTVRFDVIAINVVEEDSARLRHLFGAYTVDS